MFQESNWCVPISSLHQIKSEECWTGPTRTIRSKSAGKLKREDEARDAPTVWLVQKNDHPILIIINILISIQLVLVRNINYQF